MLIFITMTLAGCKYTRMVPDGTYLLQKNRVEGVDEAATETEVVEQIRHEPNRKIFFFKAHMWANYFGKKVGLKKIGEEPILVDSSAIKYSAQNIERFLIKRGYFNSHVTYRVDQTRISKALKLKKKRVTYVIEENAPYRIGKLSYKTDNTGIQKLVFANYLDAKLNVGDRVNFELIGEERDRITKMLRNNGYFKFNSSFIDFVIDTTAIHQTATIDVQIAEPDSSVHKPFNIKRVNVVFQTGRIENDTVRNLKHNMSFVMNGFDISSAVIANNILLKEGELFRQRNLSVTYERLINLNLFNNVQVGFESTDDEIIVNVLLSPSPKFDFIWQPQIITTEQRFNNAQSSRNGGLANEFTLTNKNVFHNGEEFRINIRTALETQLTRDSASAFSNFVQEFNTELKIPQLLFFRKKGNALGVNSVSTNLNASYLFESNPFYQRNLLPFSYSYSFEGKQFGITYSPLLVSLNQASYKPNLFDQASASYIETLDRIFTNNLITSQRVGGYYTSKKPKDKRYWSVYSNLLEVAGLWLPLLTDGGAAFGVNHSTFIRSDIDLRYNAEINDRNSIVARIFTGIGVPFGSKSVLPFERRFISGGSNNLRGWRIRTVGPGSFSAVNNLQLTRTGEMGLVGNLEYRFNMIRSSIDVNGAVFLDAGNVWNLESDTLFPGGEFNSSEFMQELAVNTGFGLRFDADFLVIRADLGIPLWDPNFALEDRLVIKNAFKDRWILRRPVWNVAVGYPF